MPLEVLAIPLALSLVAWSSVALILHAFTSLIARASTLKRYTAKQMLIAVMVGTTNGFSAGGRAVVRIVSSLARWWLFFMVLFLFFSTLYVTFTEFPEMWWAAAQAYNRYLGPYVSVTVMLPLRILDLILRGVIPVWNSTIWFLKALLVQGLLPLLIDDIETVLQMAASLVSLVSNLCQSFFALFDSFFCQGMTCLHPEQGVADLLSSMTDVREIALLGTQLLRTFCSTLAAPFDIILYPLTDLNFAESVHNLGNAAIQLVAVIPRNTAVRCAQKEDNPYATLMCTPDMAPFFNFLAAGLTSLGLAIDNWLNVALVIVQSVVAGNPPKCDSTDNSMIPDLLANNSVFKRGTALVGLTDWLYAVTDGVTALYMGHNDGTQTKMQSWPYAVDVALGVAAVTYSEVHDLDVSAFSSGKTAGSMQTTAMLGCNCSDAGESGMAILCAILPMSGVPSESALQDYRMQVLFSDPAAPSLYTCAGVDIYVKSVRWSYTRYESDTVPVGSTGDRAALPTQDCISRGTCRELDATVWLVPRCGQDSLLNSETACLPVAPCYPFCMAARAAGSGRANLVLVRAARWREGATILGQDCALEQSDPHSTQLGMPPSGTVSTARSTQQGLLQTGGTAVYAFAQTAKPCITALGVTSTVQKNHTKITAYGTRVAYNVVLEGQPFVVTGDTLFTTVPLGGGVDGVQVERLEGDETDVFSLNSINQQLPSHPKAVVPLQQAELDSEDRLTIPYSYQTTRIAATNSRNYVFYASNPNADVLGPYLAYCANKADPEKLSKFGILFTSSYSSIRVYRVSAYRRCRAYSCGADLIRFTTFEGFNMKFGRECDGVFNMSISALEYLNEDNIAVTVVSSPVTAWDETTGEFVGASSTTYWLNPATMRVRSTIWQTDPASSGIPTQIPVLCPALQRLPRLGSFAAELLNSGLFLVRFAVYTVAYTPGLVAVWSSGPSCPAPGSALYHSILANCGERVYSLDDFFDSLDDAGAVFWHSLSLLARLIAPEDSPLAASPIVNVLDGMSNYGQGSVDIWATGAGVLTLTKVPIKEQATQLWATVQAGTAGDAAKMIQGLAAPGAGVLAWSRYSYRLFSKVTIDLLKRVLDPLVDVTLEQAFLLLFANAYDLQEEFRATVTTRTRLACAGIKLMFGVENPWANLLYHQCVAAAELTDNLMVLTLNIFVQIPMAKCVCKDVSSRSVASFVTERCAPSLPLSLLPTLYSIANQLMGTGAVNSMACEMVLEHVKSSINGSMNTWFTHQYLALDALGSSVEYALATFDDEAGRCLDFQNDPHVVVIVPEPVDYFHRCGGTSLCRQVCSREWLAFQEAAAITRFDIRPLDTLTISVESSFFPGELDADLMLSNVSASVEMPLELGGCLARSGDQQDFALAVAEVSLTQVSVQYWCIPQVPTSTVYRSDKAGFGPLAVPGAMLDLGFGDDTGSWLIVMSRLESAEALYLLNTSGVFMLPALTDSILGTDNIMLRIENLWLIEGMVLIDVLARRFNTQKDPTTDRLFAESDPVSLHFHLLPPLGTGLGLYGRWRATDVDLTRFGRGEYWYTKQNGWEDHLFIPKAQGLLPFRVVLVRTGGELVMRSSVPLAPVNLPAMGDASLATRAQSYAFVFATSRTGWDWLKQVRLATDGVFDGVFGSTGVGVNISIKGSCNERGCDGCTTLQLQRLCLAYSKCALINCVGTPVHQRRPLCGIGALLRQTGRMGLLATHGAWAIFSEMLSLTMQLSLLDVKEAYLLWPEDQFLGYMCQAKDTSAEFFSILTATINTALQLGNADIGYMYGGASNVDTNADAVLTITSTSINAFMHQLALFPLYGMAVSHQILMCQVSGIIALVPTTDFTLTIQPALVTPASSLIAGQCLTVGAEVLASYPRDDPASLATTVTSLVSNALQRLLVAQIEPVVHMLDGFLAYWIGVVKALAGLVQAQNMARCNPPDFFLKDVVNCACGDQALQIPDHRRREGLAESALWCTGVLGMIDSSNQPYYVYNKYSYAQLQARSNGLANYTSCVRDNPGYSCEPPNEPFFANQGVTLTNVLVKCRENFIKKRWDPAAFILYQPMYWDLVDFQEADGSPALPDNVRYNVRQCMEDGDASSGSLVQWCLENVFYPNANISAETYWQYERLNSTRLGPEYTDACLAFSGPAEVAKLPIFQACVDGAGAGAGCSLTAHMWSPRSDNSVPVAEQHRVISHGVNRDGLVQTLYEQARVKVMTAIQDSLAVWNNSENPDVNAEFFSVEGDILHQAMDCMFMGPYSRVDYWPTPPCYEGDECLRGPFWSRDEDEGQQRHVDPATCTAPPSLPFTCGSPARQSLMRYLVLQILQNGTGTPNQNSSNIASILRATLADLASVWGDKTRYGCDCGDGDQSPLCCATNSSTSLLPDHLNQKFTSIKATTVLAALEDDMASLYKLAMEQRVTWSRYMSAVAPGEFEAYNWSNYLRVTDEARFNPVKPTSTYAADQDAMSPLQSEDLTLWDVCHASLKQVLFTLPMDPTGNVLFTAEEFDGNPAKLQEYVQAFTAEAFWRSPLFRHYSPRHAPSPSQMCLEPQNTEWEGEDGSVMYTDFVQDGITMVNGAELAPLWPAFHPQRFRVGADSCLCGWRRLENSCRIPTEGNTHNLVCQALRRCSKDGLHYNLSDQGILLPLFSPAWYCPEIMLSPHWGLLDPSANEEWLGQNRTNSLRTASRDLFRHGRSGLRAGNVRTLPYTAAEYINPLTREIPLEHGRLTTCHPSPPLDDLLRPFLDDLFPASHAVDEQGAASYCLRYAIELARLEIFRLLDDPGLEDQLVLQREVAEIWRKRCGTQLHLLFLCVSLDVFRPLEDAPSREINSCPHFTVLGSALAESYTTPQCLVSINGLFYDPCRDPALSCTGDQSNPLSIEQILASGNKTRIRFDPRTILKQGAPIGWIDGLHPLPDPEASLLRSDFASQILNDLDAVGNVPPESPWWSSEGPMQDNSEFCDSIVDWWPDDWDFPVGYHVTTPCSASETAYRGFSQAFAWDEDTNTLVYQHDLLRDAELVDSHFGATGLCRSGSFGMPMPETNNMRYCTQVQVNDTEDFALPLNYGNENTDTGGWSEWKCTQTSSQLPWPDARTNQGSHQSAQYSIGTLPNMPPESSPTYPASEADMFDIGPWQEIIASENGWGDTPTTRCKDFDMFYCVHDNACPTGYHCRGKVCSGDYTTTCTSDSSCVKNGVCRGVCLESSVACIRHSECPGEKMCSGMGTCETPTLVVQNHLEHLGDNISLSLAAHGTSCGAGNRNFSLIRGSYWGNTGQDLLRVHGMCSFENWFKYSQVYSKPGCSSQHDNNTFLLDPYQCNIVDLEQVSTNATKWWPSGNLRPDLMYVRPTICDRDYERLEGFVQCAPDQGTATMLYTNEIMEQSIVGYDRFVRLHETSDSDDIALAIMPEINENRVGFLGMSGGVETMDEISPDDGANPDSVPFVACGMVGQCFPSKFTVRGNVTVRSYPAETAWTAYNLQDAFTCGVFGVQTASGCVLDVSRLPLYRALCMPEFFVAECKNIDEYTTISTTRVCNSIPMKYQASNSDRTTVLDGLRNLFYFVRPFDSFQMYLKVTNCMSALHTSMADYALQNPTQLHTSLYFPFMFALFEIPFDWFYQCVVMSGTQIQEGSHVSQNCLAYATRRDHTVGDYKSVSPAGDSVQTYLQYIRGGYLPSDVASYRQYHLAVTANKIELAKDNIQVEMFPRRPDMSFPRCSQNILWRVGPYGDAYSDQDPFISQKRAVIWNWYDGNSCALSWHEKLLTKLEVLGINRLDWVASLTEADPVNLVNQDGSGQTSIIKLAKAFMLSQSDIEVAQTVYSRAQGVVRFNNSIPSTYDHTGFPLPDSLRPSPSSNAGTSAIDESVNRTCAFLPEFDPAFTGLSPGVQSPLCKGSSCDPDCGAKASPIQQEGNRVDYLRFCNHIPCSTIPTVYKRNGKFNCRYVAAAVIDDTCTESAQTPGCETQVMDKVYSRMFELYMDNNHAMAPILPPTVFPWFEENAWSFESLDLSDILDYERNIQPNPERAVMCEINLDADAVIKFTDCNNPHYLRLQQHAERHYKHNGAVIIPAGAQLEWPIQRRILKGGVILSYANANRPLRKRYMDTLFDNQTVCKGDPQLHVCRLQSKNSQKFRSVNPWTLGNFNPYEACDVEYTSPGQGGREYIYTSCPLASGLCPNYLSLAPPTCQSKHRRLVQQVGVPRFNDDSSSFNEYNLCHHTVDEDDDGCMHDQGLLGGYDGLTVGSPSDSSVSMISGSKYEGENYTVGRNLYEPSKWSIPDDFRAGLFAGRNPLWQGDVAQYGHLQIDEDEIGGHRIGIVVLRVNRSVDNISTMLVDRLPLGTGGHRRFLDEPDSNGAPVAQWVENLQKTMQMESEEVARLYSINYNVADLAASCPLQRWTFYSGSYAAFSPSIPSAKRARHLFHRIHKGLFSHPTMLQGPKGSFLGKYKTSNGFCACPVLEDIPQQQCQLPITDTSECSLRATIRALMAESGSDKSTLSYVFPVLNANKATRFCRMLLDWPTVDGVLRDSTTVEGKWGKASYPAAKTCHVLDRFRPFRYKYKPDSALASSGKNTVRHGVCKTSRLVTLKRDEIPENYTRCVRASLGDSYARIVCNTTEKVYTIPRRQRLTLAQVVARRESLRTRCSQCSKPPGFRSQQGRPIPPESSVGVLHRTSPERLLAKDLVEALCPTGTNCPALNASGWRRGEFMHNYMFHPERLFLNRTYQARPRSQPLPEDPAVWTAKPWVYCPTAGSLRTGDGCLGTMSRSDWISRKTELCPRLVRSISSNTVNGSGGDPMARTTFCPIDNTTDAVCKAIAEARQLVIQANCIARGDPECMPQPFVYHPASYEPSNNAWVHSTVKAFYTRVDNAACPQGSSTDQALLDFTRTFQRDCPANGLNILVGVLRSVRTIVAEVALLFTTMLSMAFKTLQLIFTKNKDETKSQIGANWAYIRNKGRAALDTVGDLMVDTLLNSGEAGARIMDFLKKTCDGLNLAAEWFLNVWCNYVQKYMLQFLAGVRKLLGITGAGFDILQDFMDEIFQGVLPAAFVTKYATGTFQDMLAEFYSNPTEKKSKGGVAKNVPDSANPRSVSRTAAVKSSISRVFGQGGRIVKGIAKASVYGGMAVAAYETFQTVLDIVKEEKLRKLYPENFTLFDLSDIMSVVDDMEDFLLSPVSQDTCVSYQLRHKLYPDRKAFTCLRVDLKTYESTAKGTTSIGATKCWANSAPSLGQSSMFSCVSSSTCCRTPECNDFILCATCPAPAFEGVAQYGCDSLRQMCTCGQLKTEYSRCTANRQCDANSECELVSALNSVSYGTIPCGNCPNSARLMCLLPPTGMPARCSCMLAGAPSYDLCNDQSGARTPVDGAKLCGYLHNRRADMSRWVFDMEDLIMLPCTQVSTGICSTVQQGSVYQPLRMVVAETLRLASSSGRRRLMTEDQVAPDPSSPVYDAYESDYELADTAALHELLMDPGWNTTAAPCSTLVMAYQKGEPLGLLETHVLHRCGFWRYVGRRVIDRYNLSEALRGHETFLLSMDDLVYAAMTPGAAWALAQNPALFVSAFMHHPWMKPVRALGVMAANQLEYLLWMRGIDSDVHDALFGDFTPEDLENQARERAKSPIVSRVKARFAQRSTANASKPSETAQTGRHTKTLKNDTRPTVLQGPNRRILTFQDVLAYSASVIQNPSSAGQLPPRVYGAWYSSDFSWPPQYNYTLQACPMALYILHIGYHVALINKMYFQNFSALTPPIDKSLRGTLPAWDWTKDARPRNDSYTPGSSWASTAFRWLLDVTGVSPSHLTAFFESEQKWSLQWILASLTRCDLASSLTCSRHEKDVLMSTVFFIILYLALHTFCAVLGIGFVPTLFVLSYPWFILWYSFGMPPACTPMIPACLLSDVIATVESLVPQKVLFPHNLLCKDENNNTSCLRSCSEIGFINWVDPLAFALCDTDYHLCSYLHALGPTGFQPLDEQLWDPAREAMHTFQEVIRGGDVAGHRLCTWVSFVTAIPVIALLVSALLLASALAAAILDMLPSLVAFLCQTLVFYES